MAGVSGGTKVLPPSSVVRNAASAVNPRRRSVATTHASVQLRPHSAWKSLVSLRKIVLSRKACPETLFVRVSTPRRCPSFRVFTVEIFATIICEMCLSPSFASGRTGTRHRKTRSVRLVNGQIVMESMPSEDLS